MPINSFENYPMTWKPQLNNRKPPIYKTLAMLLEEDIEKGNLNPGDKLPPQRELADFLDLNLSTITRAFKLCEEKGLICAKVGKGTFISSDVNVSNTLLYQTESKGIIELGTVHPPYEQNTYIINFIKNVLKQPEMEKFLQYMSPSGTHMQKKSIAKWLERNNIYTKEENVLLSTGGQNAICATLLGLFKAGDRIATDSLSFSGIKSIAKMIGIQLVPIPQENNEMSIESLENYCKNENIKGIYIIPDYHNPTTHSMSNLSRKKIAEIAKKYNIIIIEDAINSIFKPDLQDPVFSLASNNTIYILSTSKFICAGLRVAFVVAPKRYIGSLENALYNMNLMVSPFNAEIVHRLLHSPIINKIIEERKDEIIKRNEATNKILSDYNLIGDKNCSFRWLILPDEWDGKSFEIYAKNLGVQVYCAERFSVGNSIVPKAVRICVTAPKDVEELEKGLNTIKSLLKNQRDFPII
ncbi:MULTISPECIES: PLP-dependent aminotransferase family protein [unclassified Clostridioides]|uniref:aminotransferase-like domain-containing protein n=1 Tax=unclassified Clostridioides TaxID=2635829 RepID=UPI001D1107E9|nr:PLP-dependent aminotransferase family protein [Clostridioides sp. ZZV14-6150]MCC0719099.1 PLP-dependent aminotransferase family protein [Clostridioides sp. ZZV14-6105]MCC0720846.1 PLP-dependent aminotransferase family protein [Clostridioides sp. ZZV14-6104]MCC0728739.1 PLP-dependent aminotransferase family protein [Clostridioides sp. ZZV14-6045]MCC0741345.1 PLP-dependent aminotransferase family protein [Clostridioides sp. ZZV14-6044]MCC0749526.1 PLP-dependent aminotransferase family protein